MAQTVDYRIGRITDLRLPEGANFAAEFTFSGLSLTGYEATLTARRGANGGRVPFTWSKSGISLTSTTVSFDIGPATTDDAGKAFSTVTAQGSTDYAMTIRQSGGGAIVMRLQGTVQWVEDVGDYDPGTSGSNQIAVTVGSGTAVTVSLTNNGHSPLSLDATTADVLTVNNQVLSADDAGSDKLLFWDESEGKLSHATIGSGLTMTGTTLSASGGAGTGTVTSVAVSGSDGIEVDSGSPITSSGTIALGVNAANLKTHLSLGNVENTALSTWAGSTNITTIGTIATGTVPAANVSGLGDAATKNTGTTAGTVAAGDHTHAQLHDAVTVADTSSIDLTLTGQQISAAAIFGTTSGTVCQGNDARLSDARTPTSHAHAIGDVTNLQTTLDGKVSSIGASAADVLSVATGAITADDPGADRLIFWDESENKLTHLTAGSGLTISGTTITATGSGDVTGPALSGDNQVARFNGSTGKLIQASSVVITDEGNITEVARVAGVTKGGGGGWFEANGGLSSISPDTGIGGAAGSIIMNGSDASGDTNGAVGGAVFTYATGVNAGGNFYAQGGTNGPGGDVNTSDGGGAINTRGTGIIELGQTGTRTTLEGTATESRAIDFPDESGTLVIGPVTAAKMSAGAAADGYVLTSDGSGNVAWEAQTGGVSDGDKGDITVSAGGSTWTIENGAVAGEKIANNQVGLGKLEQINTDTLLGRDAAGVGSVTTISVGGGIEFTGSGGIQTSAFTGDVTKSAGGTSTTIANDAVTYAKIQNISATSRVLGRKGAGAGDAEECTLSEILDFVGSAAQGDILYRGASSWTRLAAGTSGHYLKTLGSGADPEWAAVSASGGGTKTYARFTPLDAQPPATNFATLDTRNSIAVLDFDGGSTNEETTFVGILPEGADVSSGLKVRIHWMATSATSGNCRWGVQFEKSGTDLDSDSFDAATEAHSATNGTSGIETVTEITATSIDSLTAGDRFRIKVYRDASDTTNDTMTGDAELIAVEIRSAV